MMENNIQRGSSSSYLVTRAPRNNPEDVDTTMGSMTDGHEKGNPDIGKGGFDFAA